MNYENPSVSDLYTVVIGQLEASLGQTIPFLTKSFLRVAAKMFAGVFIILYKLAGFNLLQMFPVFASSKPVTVNGVTITPLLEWGRLLGCGDPQVPTYAEIKVAITVLDQAGSLAANQQVLHEPSGSLYVTTSSVALDAETVYVNARAVDAGVVPNRSVSDPVSFASPPANVRRQASVSEVLVTADDGETWDEYRDRVVETAQAKPQGGAYADYRTWARSVPGIVAVYPYTGDPGEVDVYSEASVESSGSEDRIPNKAPLTAVLDAINFDVDGLASRRPVNAAVNSLPITRQVFDVDIADLSDPSLQSSIDNALAEYYASREPFILGLSALPRRDRVQLAEVIGIIIQIVNAAGATVGDVVQSIEGDAVPTYELAFGEKAKVGDINYD